MHGEHLNAGTSISAFVKSDSEVCKAIWLACFPGDTPEVPERFFRDVVGPEEGLVYRIDGRPVSMVFMLPAALAGEGERLPIQYIYAAATHPDYQRRGIFAELLRAALGKARAQGAAASFLHPGEPGLADYYARFGYRPYFTASRTLLAAAERGDGAGGSWTPVSAREYTALRRDYLSRRAGDYVDWPERLMAYAVSTAESAGGGAVTDGRGNAALCEPRDGLLFVHELLCPQERREEAGRELLGWYDCCKAEILSPPAAQGEVYGLWCPLSDEGEKRLHTVRNPYMGIALE